jgi:predicted transcriptional regulator
MARPKAKELTERELAVMQHFWRSDDATAEEAREALEQTGERLAYATVANVVRGLADKGVLEQTNSERPFRYRAAKTFDEVSRSLVGDLIARLFDGSRQAMLVQLFSQKGLSEQEREFLQGVLKNETAQENQP